MLSPRMLTLAVKARDGVLSDAELGEVFDRFAVATQPQFVALCRARGWLPSAGEDPPLTPACREYLRAFEAWLRDPSVENEARRLECLRAARARPGGRAAA